MKKTAILFGAILGLVSITANAQTATATVNVNLHPIQTIIVNAATENVELDYITEADYANGVQKTQANHLTIYSTGGFEVTVKSNANTLTRAGAVATDASIDASDIIVRAGSGATRPLSTGVIYELPVSLSTTEAKLFSSSIGGVNRNVNVNYTAKGDLNQYVNKYIKSQSPTVYTTTVTYTITAQ